MINSAVFQHSGCQWGLQFGRYAKVLSFECYRYKETE